MFIDWVCVYDDGARPMARDVVADQRRPLRLPIGDDLTIRISLINPAGSPVVLQNADSLLLTARSSKLGRTKLLAKTATHQAPSTYAIAIAAGDTKNLKPQAGTFDLVALIASPAARVTIIPISALELLSTEVAP